MVSSEIERAIDTYGKACCLWAVNPEKNVENAMIRNKSEAALIALLARDDARIARLEKVCEAARYMLAVGPYAKARDQLTVALAALDDADAPGGS